MSHANSCHYTVTAGVNSFLFVTRDSITISCTFEYGQDILEVSCFVNKKLETETSIYFIRKHMVMSHDNHIYNSG